MTSNKFSREEAWRWIDVCVFGVLMAMIMLYQLQLLIPQFASFHLREILYGFLYIRIIFYYRLKLSSMFFATLTFLILAILVGLHTYYLYGFNMAVHGFARFVHLMLIAPLAAVILSKNDDAMKMLYLWVAIVFLGVASVAYQMLGGEMPWLIQKYTAVRGDLVRHKSLMGEPNVGGIAAALGYLLASLVIRSYIIKYIILLATTFLVVASISKAAYVGFLFANGVIFCLDIFRWRERRLGMPSRKVLTQMVVIFTWLIFLSSSSILYRYMQVGFDSFFGRQFAVPGVIEDFKDRSIFFKYGSLSDNGKFDWKEIFLGQSFGRAGSAALEMGVPNAVGPHNMYLEVYIVGGFVLLGSLILIQFLTIKNLVKAARHGSYLSEAYLWLFILICLYMTGYPNIYEPITGVLFWLIVGICANPKSFLIEPPQISPAYFFRRKWI